MKYKLNLQFVIILLLFPGFASAQQTPWVTFFGGPGPQFSTDIQQTADNGYIISGYDSENNSANFYIVKLDEAGNIEWERNISNDAYASRAYSILETETGNFIAIGRATMQRRPWLVKLNSMGDTVWTSQWTNNMPQNSALAARGIILPDSRIVVIGASGDLGLVPSMFLVNQNGDLLEQRSLNAIVPPGWYSGTVVTHIEPTADGGFILTGTAGGGSGSKAFLWKFNSEADSVWSVLYSETGMRAANSVKQMADGGYIMAGFSSPNSEHNCVMRTDSLGNVIWFKTYPDEVDTQATDVIAWHDGTFRVTEKRFFGAGSTIFEAALLVIDADGNLLNRDIISANDAGVAIYRMRNTNDEGFVMAGEINELNIVNQQDLFVLKSDPLGDITTSYFNILTSAGNRQISSKQEINIRPNPVAIGGRFIVDVPKNTTSLAIHTVTGSLLSQKTLNGEREIKISAPALKGIYLIVIRLQSGEVITNRLLVI